MYMKNRVVVFKKDIYEIYSISIILTLDFCINCMLFNLVSPEAKAMSNFLIELFTQELIDRCALNAQSNGQMNNNNSYNVDINQIQSLLAQFMLDFF